MFSTMASTAHELNSSAYYTTNVGSSLSESFSVSSFKHENVTSAMNERLPEYLRTTSMVVCIVVMILGVVGNLMVPLVVLRGKDMRNSTNIFLVNLSVADLCVLLVCAPTVLVEVNSNPQVWPLGEHMCKAVPFVEMTVAHASVLTILAISFERYYAICEPLRAGYVCTKARATFLCFLAWATAALCTSPMIWVTQYEHRNLDENVTASWSKNDSSSYPVCTTPVNTTLALVYFVLMNFLLFALPLLMLVILYSAIVRHLVRDSSTTNGGDSYHVRARKQVVLMLLAVIFCFFVCLTPFRIFTLYLALGPSADVNSMKPKTFYNVLYFTRNMFYLNSAINPILYNLMSTRFRAGFLKLCGLRKRRNISSGTFRSTVTGSRFSKRATRKEQQENFL